MASLEQKRNRTWVKPQPCSNEHLIRIFETQFARFESGHRLAEKDSQHLSQVAQLLAADSKSFHRDTGKRKSQRILLRLWKDHRPSFFLCALGMRFTWARSFRSESYLSSARQWWATKTMPPAMFAAMREADAIIP